jgi:nucleotide-binding universal stress UspA family protein
MTAFDRLIVGIDGRDGGRDAVALARTLAGPETEITLLNAYAYDSAPSRGSLGGYERLLRDESDELLARAASTTLAAPGPHTHVRHVADVSPSRAIQQRATREKADLIVVGSCHYGPVGRVVVGDVSRGVLHGAPCAVAVAPHGYHRSDSRRPGTVGVGFNDTAESRAALELAASLAQEHGAALELITAVMMPPSLGGIYAIADDVEGLLEELRSSAGAALAEAASELDVPVTTTVVDGSARQALEQLSREVDLVVTGSRGWGAARRVILGSASSYLTHHAGCPVIVVPTPAGETDEDPLVAASSSGYSTS